MESLAEDPALSNDALQVVVVGNSRSTLTIFAGDEPRLAGVSPTADLAAGGAAGLARCGDAAAPTVVVSVVPSAWPAIDKAFRRVVPFLHAQAPIASHYLPPEALGLDRLANALAGRARYGAPVLVVDCGTATTFTLVNAQGELAGGAITAGLGLSRDSLANRTAQLPSASLEIPDCIVGIDTASSLQVGLVRGHAAMIRSLAAEMAPGTRLILTGGWSSLLSALLPGAVRHDNLTPWGGKVYWEHVKPLS